MRAAFAVDRVRSTALRALNYSPEVEVFRKKRRGLKSVRLGSLLAEIGPAYGSVFTRLDCHPSQGVELVSQTDMFAAEPMGRVIRRDSMPQPAKHEIKRWQILIAGAGTLGETELYGRSIIADRRLAGKYVGPHAMVLDFQEPGSDRSLFTYAFLAGRIGVRAIRSASYGTKILGVRSDILADLQVPVVDERTEAHVSQLVRTAVANRERYLENLQAARRTVEGLPDMIEARSMCEERRARCVVWNSAMPTLTGWAYASTGGALGYLKKKWTRTLQDVLERDGLSYGERSVRIPCQPPFGVDFFTQRDLFLIRPKPRRVLVPVQAHESAFANEGSLLLAGRGTLGEGEIFGRIGFVSSSLKGIAITEDLLRMRTAREHSELAFAFLSTIVGLRLLRSTAVGTKILNMRPSLLRDLPFPSPPALVDKTVRHHVSTAMLARVTADAAEAEAIRIVEEEVLPPWLD